MFTPYSPKRSLCFLTPIEPEPLFPGPRPPTRRWLSWNLSWLSGPRGSNPENPT